MRKKLCHESIKNAGDNVGLGIEVTVGVIKAIEMENVKCRTVQCLMFRVKNKYWGADLHK